MTVKLKGFTEVDPWELDTNMFKAIGKDWMELVVGSPEEGANAMTAAWGGMGVFWNFPVAYVVVRGEKYRYSRHLMDSLPLFTLCFLDSDQAKAKAYLGKAHGWDDHDKIGTAGLHTGWCGTELIHDPKHGIGQHVHAPFIEESKLVLLCETVCAQELGEECYVDPEIWEEHYTTQDQHRLYIAHIRAAFTK